MKSMPQVQIHGIDDVRIDEIDIPQPGENDVLVKVVNCGICGSDLGYIAAGGLTPPDSRHQLGHEFSGTIAVIGSNVAGYKVGQRVTVDPEANGQRIGNGGTGGAFAHYVLVKNVAHHPKTLHVLPEDMTFEVAALVEPLSVAMHAVNQSNIKPGQSALVMGAGPIGLCAVVVLKYYGIKNIAVCDRSEFRLEKAAQLGADMTCNVAREDLRQALTDAHGEAELMGAPVPATDVYIEATGAGPVLEQAIDLSRHGAHIVVVGVHKEAIQLHPLNILIKELRITGSMAFPDEFPDVIKMLESVKVDVLPLISHRMDLKDFSKALEIARNTEEAAKVMIVI